MSSLLAVLFDIIRALGINLIAAKGTGKTRLLGRILVPQDIYRGIPTIVIDPIGETISNILGKLIELPREIQEPLWNRVKYVDMAGRDDSVTPLPLWYRMGNESLYQVAQRPLDLIRKADPFLLQAPIHGWNPTYLLGTHAGIVLYACGCQISELEHLITCPEQWESRLQEVEKSHPEAARSVVFIRRFAQWGNDRRISRSESLLTKAMTFTLDPTTLAIFGASKPHIDIAEVITKKQLVLIDVSGVTDIERRRFILMHLLSWITAFIKARGPGFHHPPLSLVVDEFSLLTHDEAFSQELDELINVYSRSHRLWLTIASQSIGQFSEATQRALLSLGTQIFGAVPDMESAVKLVQWFANLDPKKVKHYHPIYTMEKDYSDPTPYGRRGLGYARQAQIIDFRPEFSPLSEQEYEVAKRLRSLKRFSFLIRPAITEGTVDTTLYPVTIRNMDAGSYGDRNLIEQATRILRKRTGVPVAPLLAEIASRVPRLPPSPALPRPMAGAALPKHAQKRLTLPPPDPDVDVS